MEMDEHNGIVSMMLPSGIRSVANGLNFLNSSEMQRDSIEPAYQPIVSFFVVPTRIAFGESLNLCIQYWVVKIENSALL